MAMPSRTEMVILVRHQNQRLQQKEQGNKELGVKKWWRCSVLSFLHSPYQHFNKYSPKHHGYGLDNWESKTPHPFPRSGKNKKKEKNCATVRDADAGCRGEERLPSMARRKAKQGIGHRHLD
jgi:hypothetical protein